MEKPVAMYLNLNCKKVLSTQAVIAAGRKDFLYLWKVIRTYPLKFIKSTLL